MAYLNRFTQVKKLFQVLKKIIFFNVFELTSDLLKYYEGKYETRYIVRASLLIKFIK